MAAYATPAQTLGGLLDGAAARLRAAGVEGARRDARLLLAHALDLDPAQILAYPERPVSAAERARAAPLLARRAAREPVSRILGRREFWGLDFAVTADTLDPRPDSETLVRAVLDRLGPAPGAPAILDLGTGTGCLLLALLSELPHARGLGIDVSPGAVAVARANAARLGLAGRSRVQVASWSDDLPGEWQVIVSNPPYIMERQIEDLAPEVALYEPRLALAAGSDGLAAYRSLIPRVARMLAPGGLVALEVGAGQRDAVDSILDKAGLAPSGRMADLAGIERCVLAGGR